MTVAARTALLEGEGGFFARVEEERDSRKYSKS